VLREKGKREMDLKGTAWKGVFFFGVKVILKENGEQFLRSGQWKGSGERRGRAEHRVNWESNKYENGEGARDEKWGEGRGTCMAGEITRAMDVGSGVMKGRRILGGGGSGGSAK
jgi:hypothetical protein